MIQSSITLFQSKSSGGFSRAHEIAEQVLGSDTICFLSSPRYWAARWASTVSPGFGEEQHVFEARWFNENGEVRWMRTPDGGRLATLSFDDRIHADGGLLMVDPRPVSVLERKYRCWGTVREFDSVHRVATLHDRRIGQLLMPVETAKTEDSLSIVALEMVGRDGNGNMQVFDEILQAISVTDGRITE
jgi:CRISPR-associated protein (TIGR03984 family)